MNTVALVSDPADRSAMAALEPTWMVEDLTDVTRALRAPRAGLRSGPLAGGEAGAGGHQHRAQDSVAQARPALVGKHAVEAAGEHRVETVNGERDDQKTGAQHRQLRPDG